ncbi:MAG: hypothetical protein IJ106_03765 [Parasporobacterium sp.]|nr:hypothetical protein [Parasporobacterium sp.]
MDARKRPRRSAGMGYFTILLIILIIIAAAGVFVSKRFAPSKTRADLMEYYNLTAYERLGRDAAGSDELAIVINDTILDEENTEKFRAVRSGDDVYVEISIIQSNIDERFYLDSNEGLVIFTNAVGSVIAPVDSSVYTEEGQEHDAGYVIARQINGSIYLNMKFVDEHSAASYQVLEDPARVYIRMGAGTAEYATVSSNTKMRLSSSKKSSIVADISKGERLKVLSIDDGWYKAINEQGFLGYVPESALGEITTQELTSDYSEPEYTHILEDGNISMAWHGIYYYDSNQYIADYTYNMKGINILAPTWFLFADPYGDILSYASPDYVNYAHENGWKVWAVLEDMDAESSSEILPYTSRRQTAIGQIINECLAYGIDGINVDIELITASEGRDFIQFIRELSVACRRNQLVLSVDDYTPYSYNAYRHTAEQSRICDYVAIMAYDDYVGGNVAGPNSGLPFLEEVLGVCQDVVDMDRLIIGLPFYSRLWYQHSDGTVGRDTSDMNNIEEVTLNHGLTYNWLADVGYDYAEYEEEDTTVRIWYENVNSLEAKLNLLSKYNIAGVSYWRLGQETSNVWDVLSQYYQ